MLAHRDDQREIGKNMQTNLIESYKETSGKFKISTMVMMMKVLCCH